MNTPHTTQNYRTCTQAHTYAGAHTYLHLHTAYTFVHIGGQVRGLNHSHTNTTHAHKLSHMHTKRTHSLAHIHISTCTLPLYISVVKSAAWSTSKSFERNSASNSPTFKGEKKRRERLIINAPPNRDRHIQYIKHKSECDACTHEHERIV